MIEVENLVKKYGSHLAVDHLSFRVEKGQIYGFLGPNGAGKSTTMNMMTGYLAATEGSIRIAGFDMLKQPEEAKKCIGYLPEQPPLYPDMTVFEYLIFAARLKQIKKAERLPQIEEAMKRTMIDDVKNRLIKNLSKGYRQRVGLAQAILGEPEIIILDEPTVGLDPKQIIEIRDLIRSLKEKHTVILSSHILSEVSALCDQIMIISNGKLIASDTSEGLQKLMSGTADLQIKVLGSRKQAESALANLSDIIQITLESSKDEANDEITSILIETDAGFDATKEAAKLLADKKLPVIFMKRNHKSLEDIFLELTRTEEQSTETKYSEAESEELSLKNGEAESEELSLKNGEAESEEQNQKNGEAECKEPKKENNVEEGALNS